MGDEVAFMKFVVYLLLGTFVSSCCAAAAAATRPSKASEWKAAKDPSSGRTYYWNARTRQTTWQAPDELSSQPESHAEGSRYAHESKESQSSTNEDATDAEGSLLTEPDSSLPKGVIRTMKSATSATALTSALGGLNPTAEEEGGGPLKTLVKGLYLGGVLGAAAAFL